MGGGGTLRARASSPSAPQQLSHSLVVEVARRNAQVPERHALGLQLGLDEPQVGHHPLELPLQLVGDRLLLHLELRSRQVDDGGGGRGQGGARVKGGGGVRAGGTHTDSRRSGDGRQLTGVAWCFRCPLGDRHGTALA